MNRTVLHFVLALAICLALTVTVSASDIVATFNNVAQSGGVTYSTLYGSGSTTAGVFTFTQDKLNPANTFGQDPLGAGDPFLGFCIELQQTISNGSTHTFEVKDLEDGRTSTPPGPLGLPAANKIDKLFQLAFLPNGLITDSVTDTVAQAIQIAIWEIVYETGNVGLGTSTGNATFSGSGALATADGWLGTINSLDVGSYFDGGPGNYQPSQSLWAMNDTSHQDFVIQTQPGGATGEVPEPGTLALVGAALLGLGALRRKMANA